MGTKRSFLLFLVIAAASHSDVGFSFYANPTEPRIFRAAMMIPLVNEEKYGAHPDLISLSVRMEGDKPKIGLNPLMVFLFFGVIGQGLGVPVGIAEKLIIPQMLTNFRVQGNVTRHSFVYLKQVTDFFTDGVYSESAVGVGFEIKKFELYGGAAKAVLDPFGLPNEITWRGGVSKWL